MLLVYPAVIHNDTDGMWVEFPDLEGCQSQGDTPQEILQNAAEALECYALGYLEEGRTLPKASDPAQIVLEDKNSYVSLVQADVNLAKNTKSVKKTLTIPKWLNDTAVASKINFSKVLQAALMKELGLN